MRVATTRTLHGVYCCSLSFKITNEGSEGVCILKWNTMMDDIFWSSAVTLFEGDDLKNYDKPIIPIRQEIKDSDYAFIG